MKIISTNLKKNEDVFLAIRRVYKKAFAELAAHGGQLEDGAKMGAVRQDGKKIFVEIFSDLEIAKQKEDEYLTSVATDRIADKYCQVIDGKRCINRDVRGWAKALMRAKRRLQTERAMVNAGVPIDQPNQW